MHLSLKKWACFLFCVSSSYYLYCLWIPSEVNCVSRPNTTYSYIIVGAGTAGCVLAARLSENSHNQVLLIEAGSHFNVLSKIPFLAVFLQKSKYDWGYETETQKWSSMGFYNKKQALPRGKGLGGSNQINLLIHNGIDNESYWELQNSLVNYTRSKGCSKQCRYLDYLLKARTCRAKCKPYFSIRVQRNKSMLGKILLESLVHLNRSDLKFYRGDASIHKGERWSTYRSHLLSASTRSNLHVLCNSEVDKIIFKEKRAIGVRLLKNRVIYSKSEIIISAGSINTPKLLLLSGLGNKRNLEELNITVVHDLPGVGENLHDHIALPLYVQIQEPLSLTFQKLLDPMQVVNYITRRNGIFGSSPVAGFVKSSKNYLILFTGSTPEDPFRKVANYLPETFRNLFPFASDYNKEGFVFLAGCKHTQSRGFVKLAIDKSVIIDPQYLQLKADVECVKDAASLVVQILNTTQFQKIGAKMHLPQLPECNNLTAEAYFECVIRVSAITNYHLAGTCKMGNDAMSVVDHNFRVKGVTGLRIVDASLLPTPSNNFPNTVITILAEYASSLITLR